MNNITMNVRKIIIVPIIFGLIFTMGFNGFLLILGKTEIIGSFMNFYNRATVDSFPTYTVIALVLSGICQLLAALLFIAALFKTEFLLIREAKTVKWGILAAIFSLTLYGFAVRMISNHQAAANIFFYEGFLYFFLWYVERQTAAVSHHNIFEKIKLLPIFLTMFYTMGQPGYNKLFNTSEVMGGYVNMFKDTFLAQLPGGIPLFIYILGVFELAVAVLILCSLLKREFLPEYDKTIFDIAMLVTITTFIMLAFGLNILMNYPGTTNLVFYAVVSLGFYGYAGSMAVKRKVSYSESD